MIVLFDTVRRQRPVREGGELVMLDWGRQQVLHQLPLFPADPDIVDDPNPRGNSRGGKGILATPEGFLVATYHTILVYDRQLRLRGRITHNLFVNIHEMCFAGDGQESIWVSSTTIDAAMKIDREGRTLRTWWPREEPELQDRFSLQPMPIDKQADNRLLHIHQELDKSEGHTHLNSVFHHGGRTFALLNRQGAIVQIEPEVRLILESPLLRGSHSPLVTPDGRQILVCRSQHRRLASFSLSGGELLYEIDLLSFPEVERLHREHPDQPFNKSIFVRGLEWIGPERVLVGISPAAILEVDLKDCRLASCYVHSRNVADAVHGIAILPATQPETNPHG